MAERRSGRFRLGRRRADEGSDDVPCVPCGQQSTLRPFALNIDRALIEDDLVTTLVPDVAHAITGGEVVLFDPRRLTSTLLNSSAALVWASIDGVATVANIVDDLTAETGGDRSVIDSDVRDTIARFVQSGFVEPWEDGLQQPVFVTADAARSEREERRAQRIDAVLARRAWAFTDRRLCAGAAVEVRVEDDELAALLAPALAPIPIPTTDAPSTTVSVIVQRRNGIRQLRILRDSRTHAYADSASEALDTVFTLLNDIAINGSAGRLVLHAGTVERDGSVVVVAGPSGRGKSTLTAALVQRGFGYLSDEVAAIDPDTLDVLPYPKPFDLDRSSAEILGVEPTRVDGVKGKVAVDRLGAVASGGGRVRLLVLLDDPDSPAPGPTSPAEQLIELLANTFASTFAPDTGLRDPLRALADLADRVPILRLHRSTVDDAVRSIDEQLRSIDVAPTS